MDQTIATTDSLIVRAHAAELIDEFFSRVDRAEPVRDLLTEDAEFRGVQGREAVTELLLSLAAKREATGRTTRHVASNLSVEALADGQYRVRSQVLVISQNTQPERDGELTAGDHDDIVQLGPDGVFRFRKRTMTPAFTLKLQLSE